MGSTTVGSPQRPLIVESEPATDEQLALAAQLVEAMDLVREAEAEVTRLKTLIAEITPNGTIMDVGGYIVVRSERRPNRRLNAVDLLRRGVPREAFSTVRPSLTKFLEYTEAQHWPEHERNTYIIETGDPVPTVSVRPLQPTEDDQYGEEN